MALESIGQRSKQFYYDHAAGDTATQKHISHEKSQINLEMTGEPGGGERRYFEGLVGTKELVILSALTMCLYLINGEYAQTICTALTSVPPALFSYRVLTNQMTDKQGYHSILFYWTLYGLTALIDQFAGTAQGYNLCKCGLLGVFFFHAVRSNLSAVPATWKFAEKLEVLTSLVSQLETDGFLRNYDAMTPTITQFSEDDSLQYIFPVEENLEMSTACSFVPSLDMQSTQNPSPSTLKTMKIEESRNFQTMSAMTLACGGAAADIVTVPADRITFAAGKLEEVIRVTNVSQSHIMFALKTNADAYLIAAPTSGVLLSGQSMTIRVGVTGNYFDDFSDPGVSIDKLAIDYALIPSRSYSKFSSEFFYSQNRRRLAIRVFYQ